jgi:predicted dehydrogenase
MPYGIAVLGWAHGHAGLYAEEIGRMPDARILSSWDHDGERAKHNAALYGCTASKNLDEVLADTHVQGVIVAAETSLHAEMCVAAAEAGKAIVLQKPMALNLDDCDRIIGAVSRSGVPFTLAWQMRVDPQNLEIKRIVDQRMLGRIVMFRRKHCLSTHIWPDFDKTWHTQPALNRGIWMDDAAHPFDLVCWLFGKPKSVFAEIDTLLDPAIPDDNGIAVFRMRDGTMVEVVSSFTANAGENTTEIHGDRGTLLQNYGDAVSAATPRASDSPGLRWILNGESGWTDSGIPSPASQAVRIKALARPIVDFFLGQRPPIATVVEGREVVEMLLASYESSATGRRIEFPFQPGGGAAFGEGSM